jgi:hypothetical protein
MFFGGAEKPDEDDFGAHMVGRSSNTSKLLSNNLTNNNRQWIWWIQRIGKDYSRKGDSESSDLKGQSIGLVLYLYRTTMRSRLDWISKLKVLRASLRRKLYYNLI